MPLMTGTSGDNVLPATHTSSSYVVKVVAAAGVFTFFSCVISYHQIRQHLYYNTNARLRKYTVRILFMVPVYALDSLFGMTLRNYSIGFSVFRECYESFALYSFFQYLVVCLGGKQILADMLRAQPPVAHTSPCSACLTNWTMGPPFLQYTSVGILQYVPVKLLCSVVAFFTGLAGCYGAGDFSSNKAYPYISFVVNCSQCWALYCLVLFYLGTRKELTARGVQPVGKFAAIKLIIFFTWWQSLAIALAVYFKVIRAESFVNCTRTKENELDSECWTIDEISESLNDVIICGEMLFFALAHIWVFPVPEPETYDALKRDGWDQQGCEIMCDTQNSSPASSLPARCPRPAHPPIPSPAPRSLGADRTRASRLSTRRSTWGRALRTR